MLWSDLRRCSIEDVVGYINEKLLEYGSLKKVADSLSSNESTIRKYITSKGYKRIANQFVLSDDMCNLQSNTSKKDKYITIDDACNTLEVGTDDECNIYDDTRGNKIDDVYNTGVINPPDIKESMIYVSKEIDTFKKMVEWFKNKDNVSDANVIEVVEGIKIDLPQANIKRTTIRINEKIWDEFNEFVEQNKPYEKHTLMAQALKEYMEKYK